MPEPDSLDHWSQALCTAAWIVLVVGVPVLFVRAWRATRPDVVLVAALAGFALAVRLAIPWGPLNFVDADRLSPLWRTDYRVLPTFASVPSALAALCDLGAKPALLMRLWGPVMGTLSVAVAYGGARLLGVTRASAAVAGLVVATWPAHVHCSASAMLTVEAGTFAAGALALAARGLPDRVITLILAALVTLTVYSRPECRLIVIPIALLVLGPRWTTSSRLLLAALLAVPLLSYVPMALSVKEMGRGSLSDGCHLAAARDLATHVQLGDPWILLAVAGVLFGATTARNRLALALFPTMLGSLYLLAATDRSPHWGQSKYWVILIPTAAIALALALDRARLTRAFLPLAGGASTLAVFALLLSWPTLRARNDEQAAYDFVRRTAPEAVAPGSTVYVQYFGDSQQSGALLGLGASLGRSGIDTVCGRDRAEPGPVRIRALSADVIDCPGWLQAGGIVFLGVERNVDSSGTPAGREPAVVTLLRSRFALEPLQEDAAWVVPDMPGMNPDRCGASFPGPTFLAQFGWYRIKRRS